MPLKAADPRVDNHRGPLNRGRNSLEKWTDHHLEAELKFAHLFHDGRKDSYEWIACLEAEARRRGWDGPTRKYARDLV
jgi:hypothetical protein